jgi:hypothetical protein
LGVPTSEVGYTTATAGGGEFTSPNRTCGGIGKRKKKRKKKHIFVIFTAQGKKTATIHLYSIKLLKPTGQVTHHQFNIQQLYALHTLYLCGFYLSENKLTS